MLFRNTTWTLYWQKSKHCHSLKGVIIGYPLRLLLRNAEQDGKAGWVLLFSVFCVFPFLPFYFRDSSLTQQTKSANVSTWGQSLGMLTLQSVIVTGIAKRRGTVLFHHLAKAFNLIKLYENSNQHHNNRMSCSSDPHEKWKTVARFSVELKKTSAR